jgi:hypothetical protein
MKRRTLAIVTAALVLGLMPGSAIAGGGGDQGAAAHDLKIGGPRTLAQTVTVGVTGQLTGVDLYLFETNAAKMTASIMCLDRATRLPIGTAKASATVTVADVGWYHFEFATPVSFIAGGRFAIVFSITAWGVAYASLGSYPNGQALEKGSACGTLPGKPNLAFAFATWVTPAANPTAQPIPAPTPTPAPKATPAPVASKTPAAMQTSAGPSPSAAGASPSDVAASPSTSASPSTNPIPSGSTGATTGDSESSGGSPILIIAAVIAALALVAIVGACGFALGRRRK